MFNDSNELKTIFRLNLILKNNFSVTILQTAFIKKYFLIIFLKIIFCLLSKIVHKMMKKSFQIFFKW